MSAKRQVAFLAVEHLHDYLFGLEFTLIIDNKPLPTMLNPHSTKSLPPRIQRLAWRLHQYTFVFSISQVTLTQQIHYRVCRPSKLIFPTLVWFVKTT